MRPSRINCGMGGRSFSTTPAAPRARAIANHAVAIPARVEVRIGIMWAFLPACLARSTLRRSRTAVDYALKIPHASRSPCSLKAIGRTIPLPFAPDRDCWDTVCPLHNRVPHDPDGSPCSGPPGRSGPAPSTSSATCPTASNSSASPPTRSGNNWPSSAASSNRASPVFATRTRSTRADRSLFPRETELLGGPDGVAQTGRARSGCRCRAVGGGRRGRAERAPGRRSRPARPSPWRTRKRSSSPGRWSWTWRPRRGAKLLPVDSEHSAIFQALMGTPRGRGRPRRADRQRRAVPRQDRRRTGIGHARAGAAASRPGRWGRRSRSIRPR